MHVDYLKELEAKLRKETGGEPDRSAKEIFLPHLLWNLLHQSPWDQQDWERINSLSKKLDITGKLQCEYKQNWKKGGNTLLEEPWLSVNAAVLCRACLSDSQRYADNPIVLKRLNTTLKAIDLLSAESLADGTKLTLLLDDILAGYSHKRVQPQKDLDELKATTGPDKTIPLTVLFSEGPIARAYLETMHSIGLKPRKIINLVSARDISSRKLVGRWLPGKLRAAYAAGVQRSKIFHWPMAIAKTHPAIVNSIQKQVVDILKFSNTTLSRALQQIPLNVYSDSVEVVLVHGLRDPKLQGLLAGEEDRQFLYTGGGIVPKSLLEIPNTRIIHIHPGYLPDIRGADGLLWSTLTTNHPSASAFYMSPGLDTGDIIFATWLNPIAFSTNSTIDIPTQYRCVYAYLDPWVRSYVLRSLVTRNADFSNIPAQTQDESDGVTYHFMHTRLRDATLSKIFKFEN